MSKSATPPNPTPKATYVVKLSSLAEKQLEKLPSATARRITNALTALATNPRPDGVKKLKGQEGYRIRVGEYRARYLIFDKVLLVEVVKVGKRGNFYD